MRRLNEKERRFVEAYMGVSKGNATDAAIRAGYAQKSAAVRGSQFLRKDNINQAIELRRAKDPLVASREELQRFWSEMTYGKVVTEMGQPGLSASVKAADRLKASELLAKSNAMFIQKHEVSGDLKFVEVLAGEKFDVEAENNGNKKKA